MARKASSSKARKPFPGLAGLTLIAAIALAAILYYLIISHKVGNTGSVISYISPQNNLTNINYSEGCSGGPGQQYQYEGNPCHLFYINATVSPINQTLNGGVDAAINIYDNMILVPMSPPMTYANMTAMSVPSPSMNSTMAMDSMVNSSKLPGVSNLPFTTPSYYPPSNWSKVWGKLAAYNATTGAKVWEDNFSAPVMSQPIVVNNTIYVSTGSDFVDTTTYRNGVFAVDATTGKILWNLTVIPEMMPTPVYYANTLVVVPGSGTGAFDQDVVGLDPRTGYPDWYIYIGGESAMSSPALVGNTIYFGVRLQPEDTIITPQQTAEFAVNLNTKKVLWRTILGGNIGTQDEPPAVYNGIVVAGYGYFINNTAVNETAPPEEAANPSITATNLQEDEDATYMVGLNATTGKVIWTFFEGVGTNPPRSKIPAPTIYNGVVYFDNTVEGVLYALNVTTGKELWSYHTYLSDPNPAIVGSNVLDINQTGTLFVFSMNGTLEKTMNLGLAMGWCGSGQLAIVGNDLVVGGENEKLLILPLSEILG